MKTHRHKKAGVTSDRGFGGCVVGLSGEDCDQGSHGGITYREKCSCGAEREVNANGCHVERGGWYIPKEAQ